MKIVECSPFYNENIIAQIKIKEASKWIDELHVTESDKSFTFKNKPYHFAFAHVPVVRYHRINGKNVFRRPQWQVSVKPWSLRRLNFPWENEERQRNLACAPIEIADDDIVILSDIDEIIDSRLADKIITQTKKHGIITIKLRFTMFYFNLFSKNWGGPPDYSFRTFIMTGRYFKTMDVTSDQLRKMGEHGRLMSTVYCLEGYGGFHHSWLGDAALVASKLKAYSHPAADHDPQLFLSNGAVNLDYVKWCILNKKSLFPQHELYIDNDANFLESIVEAKETKLSGLFI